jgi:hypothetical protein
MKDAPQPYRVVSHDGWGNTVVGAFDSLEAAQQLFRTLCSDRWFLTDGTVKGLSLLAGDTTVETFSFSRG